MTRDDIFRMAHEVGLKTPWDLMEYQWKFAAPAAAAEREACAQLAGPHLNGEIAAAIRARGDV